MTDAVERAGDGAILFCPFPNEGMAILDALRGSGRRVWAWPEVPEPAAVSCVLAFRPPRGVFAGLSGLRLIHSTGAGVNGLLDAPDRPAGVPVARVVAEEVTQGMAQHVVHAVLRETREHRPYDATQREGRWVRRMQRHARDTTVGIMGLGALGAGVAAVLRLLGYRLRGWSRTRKDVAGVESFAGEAEMAAFLGGSDVLVVLLPLTPGTRGIVGASALGMLPRGAVVVSAGRGGQVDEAALLAALDSGHLSHAHLDVFEQEPLPEGNPLWGHPGITLTPHIAAAPYPPAVVRAVLENVARVEAGLPPLNAVDVAAGY